MDDHPPGNSDQLPRLPPGSTVCIVGAGSVGVFAAKECAHAGWVPTVFERASDLGGVWRSGNHWDTLTTNSSYLMMSVSDFGFPFEPSRMFPTRGEIVKYVTAYADNFKLWPFIQFNTTVLSVAPTQPGKPDSAWSVESTSTENGRQHQVFDLVLCCTGQYSKPLIPRALRESATFSGTVTHSHNFGSGARYNGKRVSSHLCFLLVT